MNKQYGIRFGLVVLVALVLQVTVIPVFIIPAFKPNLLLLAMVYLALHVSFGVGAPLAWGIGLLQDLFSGLFLGLNAFSFLVIYGVIRMFADRLYSDSAPLYLLLVGLATFAGSLMELLLLVMFTESPGISMTFLSGLFPHVLINLFCASLLLLVPGFARSVGTP